MKNLRKYIKQILLTEAAKTAEDLGDMYIEIEFTPGEWISVSLWKIDEAGAKNRAGEVQAIIDRDEDDPPCSGAYEIAWTSSEGAPGFGPMLYDVAMELAGKAGLMCDRGSVSPEASRVWEYYLNSRPDVISKQLDDEKAPFLQSPEENDISDDCNQRTFRRKAKYRAHDNAIEDAEFKQKFLDHWSTKAYVKTSGTPVLDKLKSLNKVK